MYDDTTYLEYSKDEDFKQHNSKWLLGILSAKLGNWICKHVHQNLDVQVKVPGRQVLLNDSFPIRIYQNFNFSCVFLTLFLNLFLKFNCSIILTYAYWKREKIMQINIDYISCRFCFIILIWPSIEHPESKIGMYWVISCQYACLTETHTHTHIYTHSGGTLSNNIN